MPGSILPAVHPARFFRLTSAFGFISVFAFLGIGHRRATRGSVHDCLGTWEP